MKQMMRMKTVLFMLTSLLMTICPVFGKSFTLDLRQTAHKGAAARLLAATPREDGEIRAVNLDAGVADVGEVAVGDELTFTLFDDVTLKLKLKEKMPAPFGGDAFLAEVAGYEGIKTAVVLCTGDGLTINVQDFRNNRLYKVVSSPTGVTVKEIEPVRGGSCGNDALTPHRASSRAEASSAVGAPPVLSAATGAKLLSAAGQPDTCVDLLVAYDGNAQSWARQNGGGLTNFAQVAVQRMNAALANTGLDASFRFRLVGVTTVAVTADDVHTALYAIDGDEAGWAAIKAARETCGADIVTTLVDTGSAYGTTGVGWSLASTSSLDSFKDSAYNVCAIRSVAQSDTMAHECGHNMGAGHSDVQTSSPGPQLYDYSSGYFFAANGTAYSTIMSYAQENPSGAATTGIPYFSSPNYVYNGAAVGDSTHDNTRTLAGTYAHVVNWRAQKVPMSYDVVFEPASGELFNGSLAVTLTPGKAGTEIRYTLDGSTPTASSPRYTGPITLRETTTIKAATVVNGVCSLPYTASYYSDDDLGYALGLPDCDWTATGDWRVQSTNTVDGVGVETPGAERNAVATLSTRIVGPASLAFSLRQRGYYEVTVLCDGTPIWSCGSTWNSSWREESTDIPEGAHDVTISVKTAYGYSGCFFGLDDLRVYLVRKPVFTPQTGASSATACTFTGEQMIEIAAPDEGATIYYTLDGSSPTGESATLYEGPFFITESAKVKAVAMVPGKGESPLAEGWFVERHTPVAGEWTLWGEGAYEAVQQDGRLIAELCWNLLGCGWSQALEPVATDPLFTTWAAANGVYLFTPTWRDKTGTGSRFGSLYSQTALYEELEHYTYYPTFVLAKPDDLTTCVGTILARNDGVHGADGIQYNGTANSLIACFASFFGTSPLAAPVASATDAAGRSFPFNVTLTNPNGAGTIYYTLDGTAPTRANGTRYTGAITILASGTTLKAVVWPDGDDAVSSIPLAVTYEDLSDAIAIDGVTWQNDVAHPWTVSRTTKGVTLSGYRDLSLTSGSVTSTLKATLQGPGVFHYKYNFQPFYSTLKFKMNGETVDEWRYVQIRDGSTNIVVTASSTTEFEWVYDYSYQDAAYSFLVCEMSDITWTPYAAPSAPAGLTASDGEYAYGTLLRWEKASGADSYSIYRGTTSSPAAAEKIGSTQKNMYWDTGAAPGRTYWYWIKAVNEYGESNVSNSASGRRQGSAVSTYTITYAPGADGTGTEQTDTKTEDIALTLKGAIFTRTGYTQTGWATSDGGEKTYDLGASYTANAAATLYPFWAVDYEAGYTTTTDVPVPYAWLLTHGTVVGGDYEAAAHATAANGRKIWTCYALGLDPANPSDDFRITKFWMDGHKPMFEYSHTTDGSGKSFEEYINKLGKAKLTDKWQLVPADGNSAFRFFTVEVVFPGGTSIAVSRDKVQLWEGGPYWATTNIGAESPEDPGYYFWWGDTVGYKRKGDAWVASDGSESNFSFEEANTPTYGKDIATLQSEGWITADGVLAPEHDAAHVQWGGNWRMPTDQELTDLNDKCDWTSATQNGVSGYVVRGRGAYASNSIFLPASDYGEGASLGSSGPDEGGCWSSIPYSYNSGDRSWYFYFSTFGNITYYYYDRYIGFPVRPVQGFAQ